MVGKSTLPLLLMALISVASHAAATGETIEYRGSFDGATTIGISAGSVDIDIEPTDGPARYEAALHANRELVTSQTGARADMRIEGSVGLVLGSLREEVTVYVPEGTVVELQAGSADIRVRGLDRVQLSISTGSGDVEIRDGSGIYEIVTSSGDQELTELEGTLSLEASSGDIDLSGVSGLRSVSTSSGDLSADDLLLQDSLEISTGSGDVRIAFANRADELRFDLRSSTGDLRVDDRDAEDRLLTGDGDILIEASSASGDQRYSTR